MHDENRRNTSSHYGGYLFTGTVISTDPGSMAITVVPDGQQNLAKVQGIPLAGTFAHALGFKETILPTVSSRVLCYGAYSGFCLIIGTIPTVELQNSAENASFPSRAIIGAGEPLLDDSHSSGYLGNLNKALLLNNQLPTDVVQGEKVIANEFGVMMGLFQLLAVLKGSELAQIQCHFLDDLVRIISHNFQHYHALGEHNIFHDGKGLHMELGFTHEPKEGLGIPQVNGVNNTPVIKTETEESIDDSKDFYKLDDERLKTVERLKIFLGRLGDFVNILLVAPGNEARYLDGSLPTKPDRGLFQCHIAPDGMFTLRTVKGMVLEKTNWIRVPHRIRTPEDPQGDDGALIEYPVKEAFDFDETYTDSGIPFLYYLQLRDYLASLEDDQLLNFKAHEKDFFVNDKHDAELPLNELTFVDPLTNTAYKRTRTLISIMPNGGISMSDAWSSAIVMEGGNIYIQPAKDLVLQPMRDLVAKVGGHVSVAAKKDLDLSSTSGGMRIKTSRSQYLYSEEAGIALHAEGPFIDGGIAPDPADGEALEYVSGIVFKAPQSGVQSYGRQVYSHGIESNVVVGKHVAVEGSDSTHLLSDGNMFVSSERTFVGAKQVLEVFSKGSAMFIGDSSTVIGKKGQTFAVSIGGGVEGFIDSVGKNKEFYNALIRITEDMEEFDATEFVVGFVEPEDFDALEFRFLSSSRYNLTELDIFPQSLVQLEDASFPGLHSLEKWVEEPVNETYPYPGADRAKTYVTASSNNTEQTSDKLLISKVSALMNEATLQEPVNLFELYTVKL